MDEVTDVNQVDNSLKPVSARIKFRAIGESSNIVNEDFVSGPGSLAPTPRNLDLLEDATILLYRDVFRVRPRSMLTCHGHGGSEYLDKTWKGKDSKSKLKLITFIETKFKRTLFISNLFNFSNVVNIAQALPIVPEYSESTASYTTDMLLATLYKTQNQRTERGMPAQREDSGRLYKCAKN